MSVQMTLYGKRLASEPVNPPHAKAQRASSSSEAAEVAAPTADVTLVGTASAAVCGTVGATAAANADVGVVAAGVPTVGAMVGATAAATTYVDLVEAEHGTPTEEPHPPCDKIVPVVGTTGFPGTIFRAGGDLAFDDVDVLCSKCGHTVDPILPGTRLLSKSPPKYRCGKCCTKTTMLTRMFGSWPLAEFKELSDECQQEFFKSTETTSKSLKHAVEHVIARRLVERSIASETGPFLPLSVWSTKGFNIADIQQRAKMKMHPVLGATYQVQILTTGKEKTDEAIREHMAKILSKPLKGNRSIKSLADADSLEIPLDDKVEKPSPPSCSASSSSSSSSSSSDKKNSKSKKSKRSKKSKKQHKKAKKEKTEHREKHGKADIEQEGLDEKARKQLVLTMEKVEKKRIIKVHSECTRTISKVSGATIQLEALLNDDKLHHCPKFAVQKAKDMIKAMNSYTAECREQLGKPSPRELSFTMEDVGRQTKEPTSFRCR
jgi:hypothetical protein